MKHQKNHLLIKQIENVTISDNQKSKFVFGSSNGGSEFMQKVFKRFGLDQSSHDYSCFSPLDFFSATELVSVERKANKSPEGMS